MKNKSKAKNIFKKSKKIVIQLDSFEEFETQQTNT